MRRPPNDDIANSKPSTDFDYERAAGSPSPTRTHPFWFALAYSAVLLCTLSLGAAAGLRIFYHDRLLFLIWINAFTRYVYLPAYACLAWAAWNRRWSLTTVNIAIVSLHIAWLAPDFLRDRRFDPALTESAAATTVAPRLRIFFANVNGYNTEFDSMLREIKVADPDLIILAEFGEPWLQAFARSPVIAAYPYGSGLAKARLGLVNVFSRLPLKTEKEEWIADRNFRTLDVSLGLQTVRIVALHAPRPVKPPKYNYADYWAHMIPRLLVEKGPLVVVGDCNATQYSSVYRQLTADRLRSAHEDRGRGYATSWPNGQFPLPPIRIDQAFLSPEVECLGITEGEGLGSDHKPLIVDVQLRANR